MATTTPKGPDTNEGPRYLISIGILTAIALCLFTARIYNRVRPANQLSWDDYTIIIAEILSLSTFFTAIAAVAYGWGHLSSYVPQHRSTTAYKCLFAMEFFWMIAIALVRISGASSLLRYITSGPLRVVLWALIGVQVIITCGWIVVTLFNCHPLRSFWEPVEVVSCWPRKYTIVYGWVSAGFFTLIDFTLAIMPLKFIWNLHRPARERILISTLMATGLLATAMAGVKMTTFNAVYLGDPLSATVWPSMLAQMEELVGIIGVCMPCLKSPAERVLRRMGVLSDRFTQSISLPSFVASRRGPDLPMSPVAELPSSAGPARIAAGGRGSAGGRSSSGSGTSRSDSIKGDSALEVVRVVATTKDGGDSVRTGGSGRQGWEAV